MARAIMVQGTMSGAGKSLLTAALCRIFTEDGFRCAPFKSQNMALNSFITKEGLEIGRAQAMQAEAAGIEPPVLMNPVLLKPTTDVGSQVIVNGEVRGNMRAAEYFRYRRGLIPEIMQSYNALAARNDIIVIEGAGSPAELNLKTDDIVNMGMARLAEAPVLLVGDIDRGGVFAQLIGTVMLLEPEERARIKGLVVNRFRGDRALFDDGVRILHEKSGVPVAGVLPYMHIDIDDEDSLSEKLDSKNRELIDIAVIRLPKISNYTDFDVFGQYNGVSVRYVTKVHELGTPDMLILPGSKSTIVDMLWLRENGFDRAVKQLSERGVPVFGICGGYQMLGKVISDPECTECGGEVQGIGLLDTDTVFRTKKTRLQTQGRFAEVGGVFAELSGAPFEGYEIHMGETSCRELPLDSTGRGAQRGSVYGSYVHGLFDRREVSEPIVTALYRSKGLQMTSGGISRQAFRQTQYKLLSDTVRENLDMKLVYEILGS